MGRFNLATQAIRDALKAVDGMTLPSVNVIAWIAQNVRSTTVVDDVKEEEGGRKFQVVLGGEGGEMERLVKERLAEAQRCHYHSSILGMLLMMGQGTEPPTGVAYTFDRYRDGNSTGS